MREIIACLYDNDPMEEKKTDDVREERDLLEQNLWISEEVGIQSQVFTCEGIGFR